MGCYPTLSHLAATYNYLSFGCQQKSQIFRGLLGVYTGESISCCHRLDDPNIQTTNEQRRGCFVNADVSRSPGMSAFSRPNRRLRRTDFEILITEFYSIAACMG